MVRIKRYWTEHRVKIMVLCLLLIVGIGGFTYVYSTLQNEEQVLSTLSFKVDRLANQLQAVQQQNTIKRHQVVGKRNKKIVPLSSTLGL